MRSALVLLAAPCRQITSQTRLMASQTNTSRSNILAESWSSISNEYEKVLVPRFAPWTKDALDSLRQAVQDAAFSRDDDISSLVLCCGPGHELLPVARALGRSSSVLGTDLAPGMIRVARKRIESECSEGDENSIYQGRIAAEVGDAMKPPPGPYHVVFSAFGLQQLPNPTDAIKSWISAMKAGGICVVIYWPPNPPSKERDAPFEHWSNLIQKRLGKKSTEKPWDENIPALVDSAGGEIIQNRLIVHSIHWKDADDMFQGMSQAGPWHALRLRRGDIFVDELGKELMSFYPPGKTLCHKATARLFVLRRKEPGQSSRM